ncbi:PGF-pre-PGF domain-containing protein [Haloarchaeobius amylolyticus]|uniref:PGF-pre-PGF domain-containing protein n=1 Tax=Haloarchaeobius amylolyticus TaxID=1198296 RepID=A0ABD6BH47_9EURY
MTGRRLTIVVLIGMLIVGGIGSAAGQTHSTTGSSAQVRSPPADSYVVEQGSFCQPIEPLSGDETIESFYEYRSHETHSDDVERRYSSYGTTHLQRDNTSTLFLYEGPDGVSLGTVHDRLGGESPGALVTLEAAGLPHESEWVVKDDNYTGETRMDEYERGDGWASASWAYRDGRTDGGALRGGLDGEFAVTVHPQFNEDAAFAGSDLPVSGIPEEGGIEEWDMLSGSAEDPDRTSLPSLDEPVTIRTGTCEDPSVTYDRTSDGITATVTDASSDDPVGVQPTAGTDDGVRFERLELTDIEGDASLTFESHFSEVSETPPADVEPLSYLTVTEQSGTDNASATVSFTVSKDRLEERGLEADEVALYEQRGDEWTAVETTVSDESGDAYHFEADASSLSRLAVAPNPDAASAGSIGLVGIGVGLAAGAVLGLGWLVTTRARN